MLLHPHDIWIQRAHVLRVDEDESFLWIISQSYDVLDVLNSHALELLQVSFFPEVLLVIGNLDDKRHVENILKVLVENERKHVTKMKSFR